MGQVARDPHLLIRFLYCRTTVSKATEKSHDDTQASNLLKQEKGEKILEHDFGQRFLFHLKLLCKNQLLYRKLLTSPSCYVKKVVANFVAKKITPIVLCH